jgi:hypothetical protein
MCVRAGRGMNVRGRDLCHDNRVDVSTAHISRWLKSAYCGYPCWRVKSGAVVSVHVRADGKDSLGNTGSHMSRQPLARA